MSSVRFWNTFSNMIVINSRVSKSDSLLFKFLLVFVVVDILAIVTSNGEIEGSFEANLENDEMALDDSYETSHEEDRMKLVQLDPAKVGFIRQMELEPGKFYDVETVSTKPPVFLIHSFLTTEECDRIKDCAVEVGLRSSTTIQPSNKSIEEVVDPYYNKVTFTKFDKDKDNLLNINEAANALSIIKGVTSLPRDVFQYILRKFIDVNSNGYIDDLEFRDITSWIISIEEWIKKYEQNMTDPDDIAKMKAGRIRISEQTWLDRYLYDQNGNIAKRLITLTGIHPDILLTSEKLQVVHYTPGGHYHAHHDSSKISDDRPCDHTEYLYLTDPTMHLRTQRVCRFITILYYLENTEEGGETAFPAADNETYYGEVYQKENRIIDPFDLKNHCHDANLVVKPKKGLAVMWYNHYIDPETEWLGKMDPFSLHGGCDVIKGEKWIANNWILVDNNYDKQMEHHDRVLQELEEADVMQATNSEQDYNGNYLPVANINLENGENEAIKFNSDQVETDTQEDQSRNEL